MTTITREQAQAVSDLKAGYTLGHADVAILKELARIALASLEAEAVTNEIVIPEPATHRNINEICPPGVNQTLFASGWNASRKSGMNSGRIPPIVKGIDAECVGWNACRAAMLQGAPVRSSMPDGVVTAEHRRVIEMLLNVCGAAFELADDSCQQDVDGEECHVVPSDAFQKLSDALDEIENTLPTEDIDRPDVFLAWSAMPRAALKSLLQAGNSPVIPDCCLWTYDDHDYKWDSTCGESWTFIDDGPEENGVKFCQGCGKPVVISSAPQQEVR